MSKNLYIEDFHPGLMDRLFSLFGSYFQADDRLLTEAYNHWLYLQNPLGVAKAVWVSEGDDWIGFMALIPVMLERQDRQLKSYFVVNVLVHPRHQGKNIFWRMIKAAREHVGDEGASLMGHPNDLAHKVWRRAGMHFHQSLRPWWLVPSIARRGIDRRTVEHLDVHSPLWEELGTQRNSASEWQLQVSPDFLKWRFFDHPTNQYRVYWLEAKGKAVGVQFTKSMRHGVQLLVDSFVLSPYKHLALRGLPLTTLSMRPGDTTARFSDGFLRLPVKKEIPFFLTNEALPVEEWEVASLGLSVSDI